MSVTVKKMRGTSTGAWPLTIDWSPDGKRVLLALNSSVDPSPLQILRADGLELESALRGHDGGLYAARFSRDGRQVVSAGGTTVRRWETHNCQELHRVAWDGECVNSVSFSRDCRYLLFVNTGNISDVFPIHHVEVLDVTTGRIVRRLRGHTQEIYGLAFCPTNGRILSVDDDGTIWLTDLRSKRDVQRFVGHSDWLYAIGFSPDGSRFASAGIGTPDPTLRVWEIASGDEIWSAESECATGFDRLTWSRDGKKLITSDGGADSRGAVRIWDAMTGEHLLEFNHGATGVVPALSPDGSTLVTGDEKGWIQTWRLQDVKTLASGGIPSTTHTSDAINSTLGTGAASLEDAKRSLQGLIGLASVKQEITRFEAFLNVQAQRRAANLPTGRQTLHFVFCGNPGTGKTTVARILARILYAYGILQSDKLVETDRAGLVAGYVGQTAEKDRREDPRSIRRRAVHR